MPPTGRILLDTNVLIGLLAGEPAVLDGLAAAEAVYIPVIALGELYYGAQRSAQRAENLQRLEALAAAAAVLSCDGATALVYGELKAALRAQGTPIPENDLWIAALARQYALTLVSRDVHFAVVPGVTVVDWAG